MREPDDQVQFDDLDRMIIDETRSLFQASVTELEGLSTRAARLVNLGVATLAGAIAIATVLAGREVGFGTTLFVLGALAIVLLVAALWLFVSGLAGLGGESTKGAGLEPADLHDRFRHTRQHGGVDAFLEGYLAALGEGFEGNREHGRVVANQLAFGIVMLAMGVVLLLLALGYVAVVTIGV